MEFEKIFTHEELARLQQIKRSRARRATTKAYLGWHPRSESLDRAWEHFDRIYDPNHAIFGKERMDLYNEIGFVLDNNGEILSPWHTGLPLGLNSESFWTSLKGNVHFQWAAGLDTFVIIRAAIDRDDHWQLIETVSKYLTPEPVRF